ncbi:MAG: hypothetical protein PVH89_02220 [Gammaproteobacteria bacterium]|jgi:hypothetical protein
MNCKDVSRCLDDLELPAGSGAKAPGLEAHLAECRHCAEQWRVSGRLQTFRAEVPPVPAALRDLAWQLEEAAESKQGRGPSRRPVIIGSLLLFGVAASALLAPPWGGESAELAE